MMRPRLVHLGCVAAACALFAFNSCGAEPEGPTNNGAAERSSGPRCDPATIKSDVDISYDEDADIGAPTALAAATTYLPDDARLIKSSTERGALVVAEKGGRVIAEANVIAMYGDWYVDRVVSCP